MTRNKRGSQAWLIAGAIVGGGALFLIIYIAMQTAEQRGSSDGAAVTRYRVPLGKAPVKGPSDALVTIIEFSDFQCPHCRDLSMRVQQLLERSPGDVRHAFRHAPLVSAHPQAMAAAAASMAAHEQGRFWPYHDLLFARQDDLEEEGRQLFEEIARGLRLDMDRFQADMERYEQGDAIRDDRRILQELGQGVVPVLFINGRLVVGAVSLEQLTYVVEQERAHARELLSSGVPTEQLYETIISDGIGPDFVDTEERPEVNATFSEEDGSPGCVMDAGEPCVGDGDTADVSDRE